MSVHELIRALSRRWLTIVVAVVITALAGALYAEQTKPSYQSTAVVLVPSSATGSASSSFTQLGAAPITTPTPTSPEVIDSVAKQLDISHSAAAALASQISANYEGATQFLAVTATTRLRGSAKTLANAFANAFVDDLLGQSAAQLASLQRAQAKVSAQIQSLAAQPQTPLVRVQLSSATQTYATYQNQITALQVAPPAGSIYQIAGPATPTQGSKKKVIAIAALVGLLAGVGLALLRERFDTRIRGAEDVPEGEAPALGELPLAGALAAGNLPIVAEPESLFADSVRQLRAALKSRLPEKGGTVIVVASADRGDGRTFVVANLAASFALPGQRVVAVTGDFGHPDLERIFDVESSATGLTRLVRGGHGAVTARSAVALGHIEASPSRAAVLSATTQSAVANLSILPVGPAIDGSPGDLLAGPDMATLIERLRADFDLVIIDTPALGVTSEARSLARLADGVLLVARAGRTNVAELDESISRVHAAGGEILGVVVNHRRGRRATARRTRQRPRGGEESRS